MVIKILSRAGLGDMVTILSPYLSMVFMFKTKKWNEISNPKSIIVFKNVVIIGLYGIGKINNRTLVD